MDYKNTLNMPKSGFPMRAGLPKREPEMLKHWEEMDLYNLMLKKNEGKPRFALHDGPPFSNGGLHMGHALNKSLKDFITRSYAMRGYYKMCIRDSRNDRFAREYSLLGADLTISGHGHGGIWRLPFVGGVFGTQRNLFPSYTCLLYTSGARSSTRAAAFSPL